MARLHGKNGSVAFTPAAGTAYSGGVGITNWSIDYKCAADDATGMDSAGKKAFLAGLTEWSGSFSGEYDSTQGKITPGLCSGAATFVGGTGTTVTYSCNGTTGYIIITSFKVDVATDAVIKFSAEFQGSGVIS